MSLLSIAQSVAVRVGLAKPIVGVSSADTKVLQLIELINEDGQELAARPAWQILTNEATFNTVATEDQGAITTLAGADFAFIYNETMWNRTQRRPVFGPKAPTEWQQLKAQFMQGPWIQYRLRGNRVLFLPVPAAGQAIYFEWISKNWCTDSTGVTSKTTMTVDTDISKLDERLHVLGGVWRFKAKNHLDYGEDFNIYESAVQDAIGRDASKPRLNLSGAQVDIFPAIVVPAGGWMQ